MHDRDKTQSRGAAAHLYDSIILGMSGKVNDGQLLVVLGATGTQGGAVLRHFAKSAEQFGMQLRGITRDVSSEASKELEALGVEMRSADINDVSSLKRNFEGATHVFATTDSNRLIFEAIKNPGIPAVGETPRSYAQKIEMRQGANIAEAARSTGTLQRLVWSSLPSPKKWSNGRYTKVSMFDAKEDIADMFATDSELKDKLSVLLVGFYATNALGLPKLYGPLKQEDGVYELSLPMSGDIPVPVADLDAYMGRWVEALFQMKSGVTLVGSTERLTWKDWLDLWARRNKVSARYRQADPSEYAARLEGISEAVAEEFRFIEEFGFTGGNKNAVYPDEIKSGLLSDKSSTIEDQIKNCDWSSIL